MNDSHQTPLLGGSVPTLASTLYKTVGNAFLALTPGQSPQDKTMGNASHCIGPSEGNASLASTLTKPTHA